MDNRTLPDELTQWTVDDVAWYVGNIGQGNVWKSYAEICRENEVDGCGFVDVSKEDLVELGFKKMHANMVVKKFKELQKPPQGKETIQTKVEEKVEEDSGEGCVDEGGPGTVVPVKDLEEEEEKESQHSEIPKAWMHELNKNEQNLVMKLLNKGMESSEIIVDFFGHQDAAKQDAVSAMIMALTKPPKASPVGCKLLTVHLKEKTLPLYHYNSSKLMGKRYYTLLVIGQTGTGKTTLLDAFVNCLQNQEFKDNWRWKLVDENEINLQQSSGNSHTVDIHDYYINDIRGKHDEECSLRIIDTPGFGDTKGIEQDDRIVKKFEALFKSISEIDYILVTVKATETRWTHGNRYIYDRVQQIFGKDAAERFVLMCTFADSGTPAAVATLQGKLVFHEFFTFNNSALYMPSDGATPSTKDFWKMGMDSVSRFLQYVRKQNRLPLNMHLSTAVLEKREYLYVMIGSAQEHIEACYSKLESVSRLLQQIKQHEKEINENGSFEYTESEEQIGREPLSSTYQMCQDCQVTCCQICQWPANATESQCTYFNGGNPCPVCPGKCPKSRHIRADYRIVRTQVQVRKVYKAKKALFDAANQGMTASQQLLEKQKEEMKRLAQEILEMMSRVKQCLAELDEIAMKPRVFTDEEYFQQMIDQEKESRKPGYEKKVDTLKKMMARAKQLRQIENAENVQDMFAGYGSIVDEMIDTVAPNKGNEKSRCIIC